MADILDTQSTPTVGGYHYVPGGITNQKLALFGLIVEALETGAREIVLPDLLIFDQSHNHAFLPPAEMLKQWMDYFDPEPFQAFLTELGIREVKGERAVGKFGWPSYRKGLSVIHQAEIEASLGPNHLACRFARAMVPQLRASPLLSNLRAHVFDEQRISVVLQLRIETDWRQHTQREMDPGTPTYFDHVDIVRRVVRTFDTHKLLIACDEKHLPFSLSDLRVDLETKVGAAVVFKSDLVTEAELSQLNLLDLSLIDFELAVLSDRFVGLSSSTFSSAVALERFAQRLSRRSGSFIYDVPGSAIGERTDGGAFDKPELAAREYFEERRKAFWLAQTWVVHSGDKGRLLELYRLRMDLADEITEEFFISALRVARILGETGAPDTEIIEAYELSIRSAPNRAEGYHGLSLHHRMRGRHLDGYQIAERALDLLPPKRGLFIDLWVYEYGLLDEFAVNAYWCGHFDECERACAKLLSLPSLPENWHDRIAENGRLAREKVGVRSLEARSYVEKHTLNLPNGNLVMATPSTLFTIGRVAQFLGEEEAWLADLALEMDSEAGCLTVYGINDEGTTAFTSFGVEKLKGLIESYKADPTIIERYRKPG